MDLVLELLNNPVIYLASTLIIMMLAIISLVKIYEYFRGSKQGYPNEAEIEEFILPIAYSGIVMAYKTSEWALEEFGKRLYGADKKAIADLVYKMVPDCIDYNGMLVPIKQYVSEEQFSDIVQMAFDDLMEFYEENKEKFTTAAEEWIDENKT